MQEEEQEEEQEVEQEVEQEEEESLEVEWHPHPAMQCKMMEQENLMQDFYQQIWQLTTVLHSNKL